jgi:DNA invertase Pin-like site-specific DNA recombinase
MKTREVAFYARVSSEQQTTAQTIRSQVAALRQRILEDGLALLPEHEFIDEGYSGATLLRPALERLRDLIATGALDCVYVHSPDRLARKYAYQVLLVDEWQRAGVEVIFLNRALGQSPEDDLLLQVQGMVAEYERAKILERSRRGKRHAAQAGLPSVLSGAPYGYRYVSVAEGGGQARYEPIPEQARVVQQIFTWIGRERASIGAVCRRLQQAGEPSPKGKSYWDRTTVWGILKNPAYMGQAGFGKPARYRGRGNCCGLYVGLGRSRGGLPRPRMWTRRIGLRSRYQPSSKSHSLRQWRSSWRKTGNMPERASAGRVIYCRAWSAASSAVMLTMAKRSVRAPAKDMCVTTPTIAVWVAMPIASAASGCARTGRCEPTC